MRSVISSTAASEAKSYWVGWNAMIKEKGYEFKQIERPIAPVEEKKSAKTSELQKVTDVPAGDYTTEKELRALFAATPPKSDHKVILETLVSLHA